MEQIKSLEQLYKFHIFTVETSITRGTYRHYRGISTCLWASDIKEAILKFKEYFGDDTRFDVVPLNAPATVAA